MEGKKGGEIGGALRRSEEERGQFKSDGTDRSSQVGLKSGTEPMLLLKSDNAVNSVSDRETKMSEAGLET